VGVTNHKTKTTTTTTAAAAFVVVADYTFYTILHIHVHKPGAILVSKPILENSETAFLY